MKIKIVRGIYAKKGSKLVCKSCNTEVYKFTRTVKYGDIRYASDLTGINGFESPREGEMTNCPNCGILMWL